MTIPGGGARGQILVHFQKVVFLCWSFLEVYIFATTYQKAFIPGPKVPISSPSRTIWTQPYPTLPHPQPPIPIPYPYTLPLPLPLPLPLLYPPTPPTPRPASPNPTTTTPTLPITYPTLPYPEFTQMHMTRPVAVELRCHVTALIKSTVVFKRMAFKKFKNIENMFIFMI